jgi:hypothetical protein
MVIDASGNFAGVLSEGDILRAALPEIDEILEAGGSLEGAFARFLMASGPLPGKVQQGQV